MRRPKNSLCFSWLWKQASPSFSFCGHVFNLFQNLHLISLSFFSSDFAFNPCHESRLPSKCSFSLEMGGRFLGGECLLWRKKQRAGEIKMPIVCKVGWWWASLERPRSLLQKGVPCWKLLELRHLELKGFAQLKSGNLKQLSSPAPIQDSLQMFPYDPSKCLLTIIC